MGRRGPPPKRSSQRRRRNKPATPVTKATSDGELRGPELKGEHTQPATRFWEALRRSGQAQFFEPSDWAAAELVVLAIDVFVRKPSAVMMASINSAMGGLLVTEGDRRRVGLELDRADDGGEADDAGVSELDEYRQRIAGTS